MCSSITPVILRRLLIGLLLVGLTACSSTPVVTTPPPTNLPTVIAPTQPAIPSVTGDIDLSSLTGRIVFDNHDDVWSVKADGTDLTRLTDSPWYEFDAAGSPDGTQIVYRSEPNDVPELWLMNTDGSDQHRLDRGGFPDWFSDGSKIVYAFPSSSSSISIMNADGSGQHPVPNTADGCEYPSLSPDEKRVAYNCNLSGGHLMYIADLDGSRVVDLSGVGEGWQAAWSPDGQSILFASSRDQNEPGYTDIYVMRPDGSGVKRLTHNHGYTPAWSPDGSYIVFSAGGLYVMRADGSSITSLPIEGVGETSFPDWTP